MTADLLTDYDTADDKAAHLARLDAEDAERDARLRAPGALAAAALWYAGAGIAVFPLQPVSKIPYGGTRGFKDATTDLDIVKEWWAKRPRSNIGIATGRGFDVIDIDGPQGYDSLVDIEPIPDLGRAMTGSGGLHIYVAATGRGNGDPIKPSIDYRGLGGYVVAPPSVHQSGRIYQWRDVPTALIEHLKENAA